MIRLATLGPSSKASKQVIAKTLLLGCGGNTIFEAAICAPKAEVGTLPKRRQSCRDTPSAP
jgi:hypothetical protein